MVWHQFLARFPVSSGQADFFFKLLKHQRLDLQLSYGFLALGDRFTLTPELGLGLYDSGRDYRVGWSLARPEDREAFALSFGVTRRESSKDGDAPEHGVQLGLTAQW